MDEEELIEVIEKHCKNKVTSYQISTTDGKLEERYFDSGCHINTGLLAKAIKQWWESKQGRG